MADRNEMVNLSRLERLGILLIGGCLLVAGLFFVLMALMRRIEGNIGLGVGTLFLSVPLLKFAVTGKGVKPKL